MAARIILAQQMTTITLIPYPMDMLGISLCTCLCGDVLDEHNHVCACNKHMMIRQLWYLVYYNVQEAKRCQLFILHSKLVHNFHFYTFFIHIYNRSARVLCIGHWMRRYTHEVAHPNLLHPILVLHKRSHHFGQWIGVEHCIQVGEYRHLQCCPVCWCLSEPGSGPLNNGTCLSTKDVTFECHQHHFIPLRHRNRDWEPCRPMHECHPT